MSCSTTCAVGSPTEGVTEHIDLDGDRDQGVYIPPGVAHGFAALTDLLLCYLVDNYYDNTDELGLAWDDPHVGADWGLADPVLSGSRSGEPPSRRHPRRAAAAPILTRPDSGGPPRTATPADPVE